MCDLYDLERRIISLSVYIRNHSGRAQVGVENRVNEESVNSILFKNLGSGHFCLHLIKQKQYLQCTSFWYKILYL